MDAYLGLITSFGFNFAPVGWLACNGQLVSIQDYQALYSLIGTTYGGNGTTNFALPDLRSRVVIGQGKSSAGSTYTVAATGGSETVALTGAQVGPHTHTSTVQAYGTNVMGNSQTPGGQVWAAESLGSTYLSSPAAVGNMGATMTATLGLSGGSAGHANIQPYLTLNYCICVQGIYPTHP